MPFSRPLLQTIVDRVQGDFKTVLQITVILRRSFVAAISRAIAGVSHILHSHIIFATKQIFPDQAEAEFLDRWGSIIKLPRRTATFAQFTLDVTGVDASALPAGTLFQRSDGAEYSVDSEVTISSGVATASLTASTAGATQNVAVDDVLTLVNPVTGIDSEGTVAAITTEADDDETDAAYRERVVAAFRSAQSDGKVEDYERFALSVTGVSRVWIFPTNRGAGTVDVAFLELDNGDEVIPDAAKIQEVQDVIDVEKSVTDDCVVFAPDTLVQDFTIALDPNDSDVRDAVTAELEDLFEREANVAGAFKSITETYSGVIPISKIREAISVAAGEDDHDLVEPTSNLVPSRGAIARLGTITFQTLS